MIALPTYLMIGLPVRSAYGCNKLQAGLGNLVSAIKYFKNNMVDLRIALVSAITAMTGHGSEQRSSFSFRRRAFRRPSRWHFR